MVSEIYLFQVLNHGKQASPALARKIVEASDGDLKLWHVRVWDWWEIWPELVGTEGAPEPVPPSDPMFWTPAKYAQAFKLLGKTTPKLRGNQIPARGTGKAAAKAEA